MATTLPLIVPSLTPTSSPSRKSNNYNDSSLLPLNNSQTTTPISSFLNSNKTPITPDSCNSSSYTNKLPKIKLILKLPSSSSSPKERSNSNASSTILHKPINIPPSASSNHLIDKASLNTSSSQTAMMLDEIMNTLFDTTEILLRKNKNNDGSQQRKTRKYSSGSSSSSSSPKSKTKSNTTNDKLRKVRSNTSKIKKSPVKTSPSKKMTKKKQANKEETLNENDETSTPEAPEIIKTPTPVNKELTTISPNSLSDAELQKKESSLPLSPTLLPNNEWKKTKESSSLSTSPSHTSLKLESNEESSNQTPTFKLKKIKFIYNPANEKSTTENTEDHPASEDQGKRKRKPANQKSSTPKKKRETTGLNATISSSSSALSKNLFINNEKTETSPAHPIIHLKVVNNEEKEKEKDTLSKSESAKEAMVLDLTPKKKGRKRASPTKKTTKSKKINDTILPTSQRSPPQRSPKAQPQTKSYQMSKLNQNSDHAYSSSNTPSKSTFKLNLSYTPSYINPNSNDGSRFNSYLSTLKHKSSYVHSPSPLTHSFTLDQAQNNLSSPPANPLDYIPSKLNISMNAYDPNHNNYKMKTQISPTNQLLNNNLWKSKNGGMSKGKGATSTKSKKEKISIIDVLKRESQLFTSSSKKLHSKSSVSSYYGKPSRRRYSSYVEEAKVKRLSHASSRMSTKSIVPSPESESIVKPDLPVKVPKPTVNARGKSFSTPASPKNLSEDSLRTKAHAYIQRSLTSCHSLTEKFDIYSVLGYGSNGVVLGARRRSDNLDVAIKYIYKTPSSKVCEEVNILKEVSPHPSIIRYIDSFEDNNCIYLVTEKSGSSWVPSEDSNQILTCEAPTTGRIVLYSTTCNTSSLFDYIELNGCVPPPEQKRMFKAIAEAVYALHTHNIVHGDIKEENILIDAHHNPKLCDFGHARHIGPNAPPHFAVYGTLELSAPELMPNLNVPAHLTKTHVVKRYNGMAQDIWALGLVLYTMTHGELPLNHSKVISKEIDLTSNKYKEYPCTYNRNLSKGKSQKFNPNNNIKNYNNNNNNNNNKS